MRLHQNLLTALNLTTRIFFSLLMILLSTGLDAQVTPAPDTLRLIEIIHGNSLRDRQLDSVHKIQTIAGNVKLKEGLTKFDCDSAIIRRPENTMESFGNIHINDNDSIHTYSQYLKYTSIDRIAHLTKSVRLTDNKGGTLITEDLDYNLQTHIGNYRNGGRVLSGQTVLTSKEGIYNGDTRDVYFKKNVHLVDPKYNITTDSLLYNTYTQIATFIAPTRIVNKDGSIVDTKAGSYNLKTGEAFFTGRTQFKDSLRSISSDRAALDDKNKLYQFEGHVKFVDSSNKVITVGNNLSYDGVKNTMLAYGKPVMIFYENNDSTYVAGDTLYSGLRKVDTTGKKMQVKKEKLQGPVAVNASDTAIRYFLAFHHVRIFNDSLQAVSDSLYYSTEDSTFRLFKDPVVWNDKTQVTGDTMYMMTKNRKPDHLYVFYNSLIVNKGAEGIYNQIGGRTLNGYFKDGNIDYIRVKGSPAESIYYPQDDDSAFVGMNRSSGDLIDIYFVNRALNKVKFVNDVNGVMYPIRQIPDDKKELRGFLWQDKRRPKTKLELFE
ncbi:MAG: OstA-like protein [Ferruginibacter sp.]